MKIDGHNKIHNIDSDSDEEDATEYLNREKEKIDRIEDDIIYNLRFLIHKEREKYVTALTILNAMSNDYKTRWETATKELEELKSCHTQMSQSPLCKVCSQDLSSVGSNKSP
jgi:prefoldin subunit 5